MIEINGKNTEHEEYNATFYVHNGKLHVRLDTGLAMTIDEDSVWLMDSTGDIPVNVDLDAQMGDDIRVYKV